MNPSHRFRRNLVANLFGRGWSAVMALAFVPVYLRVLGPEAYGLIALYTTLQASFAIVDVGLTTTLNRELSVRGAAGAGSRDVLRTLEAVYWAMAALAALTIMSAAGWVATHWVHANTLPPSQVRAAIVLMAVVLAFQWPLGFYSGGLLGLERQVTSNALLIGTSTLRYAGAAVALLTISATLRTFFLWQAVVSALGALTTAFVLWHYVGGLRQARFSAVALARVWRFTAGMGAISATTLLLTQIDKIVLSRMLSLESFGYYSLAAVAANSLYALVTPVAAAVFPGLTREAASGDVSATALLYHRATQTVAVLVLPVAAVLALFAPQVLGIWTRDPKAAAVSGAVLSVLVTGVALNAVMNIPYMLQLAYGRTRLTVYCNVVGLVLLVPALILFTPRFGPIAAAAAWLMLNVGYITVEMAILHRRILPGELRSWYLRDLAKPAIAAFVTVLTARMLWQGTVSQVTAVILLAATTAAAMVAAGLATPLPRAWLSRASRSTGAVSL